MDIEPLLSNAVKALANRQKALQDSEQRKADLAERAGEILAGTPPGERTPPAEAAEVPAEKVTEDESGEKTWEVIFEDADWRSRIHELVACLRSHGLNAIADALMRRLPRELKPDDRDYEKYDRGHLAVYREREADEANAVNWLLDYLQAVRREQSDPAAKPSDAAGGADKDEKPAADDEVSHVIPAPPSTATDFGKWIREARELLRGHEDEPIGESDRHIGFAVRKQFLEHLEALVPNWAALYRSFQPDGFRTARELVAMMAEIGGAIESDPASRKVVTRFGAQPDTVPKREPPVEPPDAPGGSGDDQAYRELADWAAAQLKGKQRQVVELLVKNNGTMPLPDLNIACEWEGDQFARCKQHVNKKLRKVGWIVERHDNKARLGQVKGRQK